MKIGLVRHFKVKHKFPERMLLTAAEVLQWLEAYEAAEVAPKTVDLCGVEWKRCISSPLHRAAKTANTIFAGEITQSDDLKEFDILPFLNSTLRLPFILWAIVIRIKFSTSGPLTSPFRRKISAFTDELLARHDHDVLVVSHGFVMMCLQKELVRRGFRGNTFGTPENGKVYVFEK